MLKLERDLGNAKLQDLVNTAIELYWKFGFQRVSIEELCREAQVSKMTFYKHFDNKIDLVKFLLLELTNQAYEKYGRIMDAEIPFEEKVRKTIELKMESAEDISQEFLNDVYGAQSPELDEFVHKHFGKWIHKIHEGFIKAQEKGEIRKEIKTEFILYFLNHMMDMINDEKLRKLYPRPRDLINELINFFFYGILPVREKENT